MKVKILGGTGLHASERKAVAKMEEVLRQSWFAYASLLVADDQGSMDVDTLIITHDRLLLVELKEWNGKLESSDGKWFINGRYRSKSPYEIKRVHALRLTKLIESELKHKLGYFPLVEAHVVLCGKATPEYLSTSERRFVHSLDEFLEISSADGYERITADQKKAIYTVYEKLGKPRPNSQACLPVIQDFFAGPRITPKNFIHFNYAAEQDCWFEHRNGLYQEYKGHHQETPNLQSLIRRWDFNRLGTGYATQEQWASIALRESRVLNHVKSNNNQLEDYMLRPLVPLTEQEITEDVAELYELRRTYQRFDEFVAKEASSWSKEKRADITRALIVPFSELHGLGIGHRDIDSHNLWYATEQSSVVVSGFSTAFFPERGTIKDLRQVLQSSYLKLPEDEFAVDGDILDPFRQDVYMLAILTYQVCFGGEVLPKEDGVLAWSEPCDDPFEKRLNGWFEKALSWETDGRFSNASEMLAEFNLLTQVTAPLNDDKLEVFDQLTADGFIKRGWNAFSVYQNYPPLPGENPGVGNKLVYKSQINDEILLCKVWPQIQISPESTGLNRRLLQFKKRLNGISKSGLPVPELYDLGLLEGGGLLVVTRFVEGNNWSEQYISSFDEDKKFMLANAFLQSIKALHIRHIAHGDIHPGNLIINMRDESLVLDENPFTVTLIDFVDFGDASEPYNTEYGPENPAITDAFGRDRYACYKLIGELFGDQLPIIVSDEIQLALLKNDGVPPSLDPITQALIKSQEPEPETQEKPCIELAWGNVSFPEMKEIIEQDEDVYYFNCKWDQRHNDILVSYITGISSQIQINIDPEKREITRIIYKNKVPLSEVVSASSKSQEKIETLISIQKGNLESRSAKSLIDLLMGLDTVIDELTKKFSQEENETVDFIDSQNEVSGVIPPSKIWQALISTEQDLLQSIEVDSDEIEENNSGNLIIPYAHSFGSSLNFEEGDQIFVSIQGDDSHIGELVLMETTLDVLSIRPKRSYIRNMLSKGIMLNLESLRSKASRDRREKALTRVINRDSIIVNLPDFFDINNNTQQVNYESEPSEGEIRDLYDTDQVKINPKQIVAFQKLLSNGPVGVLQGPPGTGKTSFISKFIHYLFGVCNVKNILLVGQSHTAVDNVAIKSREVCTSKGLELSIVRIGHETMIDEELLHAHPAALQRQIRQKFHREYDQRIRELGRQLLLPLALVSELATLHRTINPLLASYHHLLSACEGLATQKSSQDIDELKNKIVIIEKQLDDILHKRFAGEYKISFENDDPWDDLAFFVAAQHSVNNPAALRRLKGLLGLSQEWMDVLHTGEANYDRFSVKTKQLVCGTLVGMGLKRIEIENTEFDWVIVDEASRAQASELMIALQSAKRVLLVGDQKQLPPFYEREHLKLASKKLGTPISVFSHSDFYRAFHVNNGVTLDTQYRMVKPIGDIISECFYSDEIGELKTGRDDSPSWYSLLPFPWNNPVTWVNSHVSRDKTGEEEIEKGKYINRNEVDLIKKLLQLLAEPDTIRRLSETASKEQPYPVGIITMYRAQKQLLENEISKAEWATPLRHLVKIDTVDSYQGQENKIIILSLVRDNNKTVQGFLGDAPRINVAISRAQERLIILGASRMWSANNNDSALGTVFEFIKGKVNNNYPGYQLTNNSDICKDAE